MDSEVTTIKLSKHAVVLLNRLKIHPRQSYEEIVLKLISEQDSRKKSDSGKQMPHRGSGHITTIKLHKNTSSLLNKLKIHPRQAYEEVVLKLISDFSSKKIFFICHLASPLTVFIGRQ